MTLVAPGPSWAPHFLHTHLHPRLWRSCVLWTSNSSDRGHSMWIQVWRAMRSNFQRGKICSMYKLHREHDALVLLAVPSSQEWPPLPSLTSKRILSFLFKPPSAAGRFCLWGGRSLGPFWGFRALACRGVAASD